MSLSSRTPSSWASRKLERGLGWSRGSVLRAIFVIIVLSGAVYLLWLPVFYLFESFRGLSSHQRLPLTLELGEDAIQYFAGTQDCNILQPDIYFAPYPQVPKTSPSCKDRTSLLQALSGGGRHGFDQPYVGRGCTYRWFATPGICLILERFNAIVFIGDGVAQSIYAAFNILLREDFAYGSLQQWLMTDQDLVTCKCENQFLNSDCLGYAVKNMEEVKGNGADDMKGNRYYCERIPHAYIPVMTTPAAPNSQALFKDLTYLKPNPWQPSPVIFSLSSGYDSDLATRALDEWLSLASGAERNTPMLFLGPHTSGITESSETTTEANSIIWQFQEEISELSRQKHFDMLGLYNLTLQATTAHGVNFGERVALVEAMMVINWLSKLETS